LATRSENSSDASNSNAQSTLPRANPASGANRSVLRFFGSCALVILAIVVLSIGGCALWFITQPKDVGYDDKLTSSNVQTFVAHHTWGNSWGEEGNTEYAQKALKRLGTLAYGRTFGNLMDSQKTYEEKQYERAHPTPTPESAKALAQDEAQAAREAAAEASQPRSAEDLSVSIGGTALFYPGTVQCWSDPQKIDAYMNALEINDAYGASELASTYASTVPGRVSVRFIDRSGILSPKIEVRIESGAYAGSPCWVYSRWNIFTNYARPS